MVLECADQRLFCVLLDKELKGSTLHIGVLAFYECEICDTCVMCVMCVCQCVVLYMSTQSHVCVECVSWVGSGNS